MTKREFIQACKLVWKEIKSLLENNDFEAIDTISDLKYKAALEAGFQPEIIQSLSANCFLCEYSDRESVKEYGHPGYACKFCPYTKQTGKGCIANGYSVYFENVANITKEEFKILLDFIHITLNLDENK